MPYSHEEGFPGPELESVIWPPVPLFENRDLIQQPVNMETLTPKYTNKTLTPCARHLHSVVTQLSNGMDFSGALNFGASGSFFLGVDGALGDLPLSAPAFFDLC